MSRAWSVCSAVLGVVLSLQLLSCSGSGGADADTAPPVLSVTPVAMAGPYDPATRTFGDVKLDPPVHGHRGLVPFGLGALPGGALTPGFEYLTTTTATVRASWGGEIVSLFKNEGVDDYEILIKASVHGLWAVQHDHVSDPVVRLGDKVRAGDVLGLTGKWSPEFGRTELAVVYGEGPGQDMCRCPTRFGTAGFVRSHDELIAVMNALGAGPYASPCLAEEVKP